jgi:type I restriction enzyme S subunit
LVPEDDRFLHNQRLGKVVNIREDRVTRDFLFYLFCAPLVRAQIKASASGATVRHTSPSRIGEVRASLPSIPMQNRLVEVLSAYDDLVANNLRRMQILEEMSHAVYREWFVEFRAPGVADVSDSGLPAGWHRLPLREAVEVSPKVPVPRDGEKPFVPMGCLSNDSMIIDGVESRTGNGGSKFQNGDTLFARITPCLENGKTGFVQFLPDSESVAFGSTEFIVLRSKTLTPEFVYLLARSDEVRGPAIKSMSGASGRQRVQEQCFDSMTVVQPPPDLLERFTDIVKPMFRLVHQLHLQNQSLRRTRDLLLPRLMSGQLSLPDASDQPPVLSARESAAP